MDDATRVHLMAHKVLLKALLAACLPQIDNLSGLPSGSTREIIESAIETSVMEAHPPGSPHHHLADRIVQETKGLLEAGAGAAHPE